MQVPVGTNVLFRATFKDEANNLFDPSTVTAHVINPNGVITSYAYPATIVKDGVAIYHIVTKLDVVGNWFVRFEGSGNTAVNSRDMQAEALASKFA